MLKIQKFVFNPFSENTYIVWEDKNNLGIIIDPGCSSEAEENELSEFISNNIIKLNYLINTHCHLDHIFGNQFVKENFNPTFLIPKEDLFLLNSCEIQAKTFGMNLNTPPEPDGFINETESFMLGEEKIEFLFTPGHTPGEFSIYYPNSNICFTGDVLFKQGIGRTDLWGGDYNTLLLSIKDKLLKLADSVVIYPGHGEKSTIGEEKRNNPFLVEIAES